MSANENENENDNHVVVSSNLSSSGNGNLSSSFNGNLNYTNENSSNVNLCGIDSVNLKKKQCEFLSLLKSRRPFLLDGGMGTALYARGYFINRAFDEANLTDPQKVVSVHLSHIGAGAEVIETNTFSANRCLLSKYGCAEKLAEINREGEHEEEGRDYERKGEKGKNRERKGKRKEGKEKGRERERKGKRKEGKEKGRERERKGKRKKGTERERKGKHNI
jgi:hypothetical protein